MQINKSKKPSSRQSSSNLFDNDFASGFEGSRFDKFKPAIKALVVVILLVGLAWGAVAYFSRTDKESGADKSYSPNSSQTTTDNDEAPQDTATEIDSTITDSSTQGVSPGNNVQHPGSSNSGSPAPAAKPYDPSKCEPLNSNATSLRQTADQKKSAYDNAFAARKNYGYFYSQYGNSTDAQQAYDNQENQLDLLQSDWEDALSKGNAAYSKYQECRASL